MSIKAKLSFSISIIVSVILALSILIYYFSTKSELESQVQEQVHNIAKQIGITLDTSETAVQSIEDTVGEMLRASAMAAMVQLDPDINNVNNEQLVALSKKIGVDHISLWVRKDNDIFIAKSSEPDELGASSKTWDYWFTAFNQLFDNHNVTIDKGQSLENFWSGPYNFADTAPEKIRKWGYYYNGTTNYIINPFVNAQLLADFNKTVGTDFLIKEIVDDQENLLEITGFDPDFFGKSPIIKIKKGMPVYNLDVRDIPFGAYTYKDNENDSINIQETLSTGKPVTAQSVINGQKVIKTFIPITVHKTYVICVTFNYDAISEPLNRQLMMHLIISIGLIIISMLVSYLIAVFMLRGLNQIFNKVNAISEGNFGETITIQSKDELGLLANRINTMGSNLHSYTNKLKESAEELRSTKQYLESFVNHTSDAIHVADLSSRIIQVNRAFEKMYGWTMEESMGQPLHNVPDDYLKSQMELEAIVLRGGSVTDFETVRFTKAGTLVDLSLTISPIHDESGSIIAIACISRNITSRKQSEEMIRRSEKLSVVGQIAAGVAHEVRNPLTTLRGFVQLQKQSGSLTPKHLDIMLAELDQINMIVSEFLIFAKPQASSYQPVNVETILRDMMMLLESEAKMAKVQLILHADTDLPEVLGEANQLKQVFVNVMKNGIESMTGGGEFHVELKQQTNNTVILRFIDQGCGIASEDLQRLGEPFFTRKVSGNGLGLMVSQQIIGGHKGTIIFRSDVGKGTCVEIKLPIAAEKS